MQDTTQMDLYWLQSVLYIKGTHTQSHDALKH